MKWNEKCASNRSILTKALTTTRELLLGFFIKIEPSSL